MKAFRLFPAAAGFLLLSFTLNPPGLTEAERKYALDLLRDTKVNLQAKVKGLSAEQLNFKPDATSWSVAECVEHLAISEHNIFVAVEMSLQQPADPSKQSEVKMTDEAIVNFISSRDQKVKTQEAFEPTGKYGAFESTLKAFTDKRDSNLEFVRKTEADLRNHYADFPFGKMDAYQVVLFMAGHTKRHTLQIEEVMANPGFPKKSVARGKDKTKEKEKDKTKDKGKGKKSK